MPAMPRPIQGQKIAKKVLKNNTSEKIESDRRKREYGDKSFEKQVREMIKR